MRTFILNGITHHKKTNTVLFHLYEVPKEVKFIETASKMVVARGWRDGEWGPGEMDGGDE